MLNEDFDSIGISIHHVTQIPDIGKIVLQDHLDLTKLETVSIAQLLLHLTFLIDKNIVQAIKIVSNETIASSSLDSSQSVYNYPHYFEPGITDYIKFSIIQKKLSHRFMQ